MLRLSAPSGFQEGHLKILPRNPGISAYRFRECLIPFRDKNGRGKVVESNDRQVYSQKEPKLAQMRREIMERTKNFFKDESGASALEYGLLVALISAVIITAVTTLGTNIKGKFTTVGTAVGS